MAKNFHGKEMKLDFNEFLDLKNTQQELLVSPPLGKQPSVQLKGKKIDIAWEDTLKPNTTYTFNFGNSVTDYTEGNPVPNFEFVFSTGPSIDSFSLKGSLVQAYDLKPTKDPMLVMLYDQLSDSAPYKIKPLYAGRTDKEGMFALHNLRTGTFRIFALADANNNMKYDPPEEPIAFSDSLLFLSPESFRDSSRLLLDTTSLNIHNTIKKKHNGSLSDSLKGDSTMTSFKKEYAAFIHLRMFQELPTAQFLKDYKRPEACRISFFFNIPNKNHFDFQLSDTTLNHPWYITEWSATRDTLDVWLTDSSLIKKEFFKVAATVPETDTLGRLYFKQDTLSFRYSQPAETKKKKGKSEQKQAGLKLNSNVSTAKTLELPNTITLESPQPVAAVDTSRILFEGTVDSVKTPVPFRWVHDTLFPRKFYMQVNWKEETTYTLLCLPGTITSVYGLSNDSLPANFKTRELSYYGRLIISLDNASTPVAIELLQNDKPIRTASAGKDNKLILENLLPGKYKVRAIADKNNNGHWDTGSYLKKIQPEKVYIVPSDIEIRSDWDLEISIDMKKAR